MINILSCFIVDHQTYQAGGLCYSSVPLSLDHESLSLRPWSDVAYPLDGDWDESVYNTQSGIALSAFYYAFGLDVVISGFGTSEAIFGPDWFHHCLKVGILLIASSLAFFWCLAALSRFYLNFLML